MNPTARLFSSTTTQDGESAVVSLTGELDMESAPEFELAVEKCVGDGTSSVVVDLSELTFIDSSGIAALIEARSRLLESTRELIIRSPGPQVLKVFRLTGLAESFHIAPVENTA